MEKQKDPVTELYVFALLDLCNTKSINKITVSDIVRESKTSRQTFYNNFHDINDLIAYVLNYHMTLYPNVFATREESLASLTFMRQYKAFFCQLPEHSGQNNFQESHMNKLKRMYYKMVFGSEEPPLNNLKKGLIDMYVYASVNYFFDWLKSGMTEPSDEVYIEAFMQAKPAFIPNVVHPDLMPKEA